MNGLAQAAALISAVVYIAAAPLEMFFFGRPRVRALFRVEPHNVADVRMWAFCIGFRNLLAGIGAIVGLVISCGPARRQPVEPSW
jgi:putative membrane protein